MTKKRNGPVSKKWTRRAMLALPRTRKEAKQTGSRWYFKDAPCTQGHKVPRYTKWAACMQCTKEAFEKKRAQYARMTKANKERVQAEIRKLRKGPCTDCRKRFHPFVMEFDHREGRGPRTRGFNSINSMRGLERELSKCDLVCRNCHAIRTYNRAVQQKRWRPYHDDT